MENSVLNIYPENICDSNKMYEYKFTFLDDLFKIDIYPYYSLIKSREMFKIKNLYNYLYLRLLKINRIYSRIPQLEKHKYIKTPDEFNIHIEKYINKNKLLAVIIMNSIQQFYIPLFN